MMVDISLLITLAGFAVTIISIITALKKGLKEQIGTELQPVKQLLENHDEKLKDHEQRIRELEKER